MDTINNPGGKSKPDTAQSGGPFRRHAKTLIDNGYSPVPTKPKDSKWPIEDGWQRRCKEANATGLNGKPIDGNLGVACGFNNLVVLDFDDPNGHGWRKDFDKYVIPIFHKGEHAPNGKLIEECKIAPIDCILPVCKVGKRGISLFYRVLTDEPIKSFTIKDSDGKTVIEVLGVGRHTVLPPSIHPDTKEPYTWKTDATLLNTPLDQLYVITKEQLARLCNGRVKPKAIHNKKQQENIGPEHRTPKTTRKKELRGNVGPESNEDWKFKTCKSALGNIKDPAHKKIILDVCADMLSHIPAACDYEIWRNVSFGLSYEFGLEDDDAKELFVKWPRTAKQTEAKITPEQQWNKNRERDASESDITLGTIIDYAEKHGFKCALYTELFYMDDDAEWDGRLKVRNFHLLTQDFKTKCQVIRVYLKGEWGKLRIS
jgi:hypothetical protein